MDKKKKFNLNWSKSEVFDYKLVKDPENNMSHIEKRRKQIEQGEVECSEWWLCSRK